MAQYSDKTFEAILEEEKGLVDSDVQKGDGSLVHSALAPTAYEVEKLYIQLDYLDVQSHANTADYDHLKKMGKDRALTPVEATYGIYKGYFNVPVSAGTRFNLGQYNYVVLDQLTDEANYTYRLQCETAGSEPNGLLGDLTMIDYVGGLTVMRLTEMITAGRDYESQESFLSRYYASFSSDRFGGNVADYKSIFTDNTWKYYISGIGACKVHPVWNGGGTVKLVLMGDDFRAVSSTLITQIQKEICPEAYKGYGIAPIGHDTTVVSAEEVSCAIVPTITYETGCTWDKISDSVKSRIEAYLLTLRKSWDSDDEGTITVYVSRIEAAILEVAGVVDVSGTTINGTADNLTLGIDQVPVLGSITG